jgi:hypothetical protein
MNPEGADPVVEHRSAFVRDMWIDSEEEIPSRGMKTEVAAR